MAEENKEVELEKGQTPEVPESKELSIEEAKEQIRLETEKKYKELLSSRDKANTDLKKELLATKSAEEQAKFKADEERKEWLADIAKTKAEALQLDEKHSALIRGSSKDEINQSAELVKSLIDSVNKEKDKTIKALEDRIKILEANGETPKKGNKVDSKLIPYADYLKLTAEEQRDYILSGGQIQQ